MDGFGGFDILFLALVAVFLALRLRSVLGTRTGNENPERWRTRRGAGDQPAEATPEPEQATAPDNVVRGPFREAEAPPPASGTVDAGVARIRAADPSFDPKEFIAGARGAFEMILTAYAQGDVATLRPLLAPGVYGNFAAAVQDRQRKRHTLETTLIALQSAELVDVKVDGRMAECTVRFKSQQANVTRDEAGRVVDGDPAEVDTLDDLWTFARDLRGRDPNWQLVRTEAAQ